MPSSRKRGSKVFEAEVVLLLWCSATREEVDLQEPKLLYMERKAAVQRSVSSPVAPRLLVCFRSLWLVDAAKPAVPPRLVQ